MQVTIDRITNSGRPIAEESDDGHDIIVYGAKPGETYDIEVKTLGGTHVGLVKDPSEDQCKRALEQIPKRVRMAQRHYAAEHYRIAEKRSYDYGGDTAPSGLKEISEAEKQAAKDQSKSLDDIVEELGREVTETRERDHPRDADEDAPGSELARDIAQRHDGFL